MNPKVRVELDANTALVLFELLARFEDQDRLEVNDRAEMVALWLLHGLLEEQLVEPLKPNYHELLAQARRQLRDQWGDTAR